MLEARRSDGVRWMAAAAGVCAVGALATAVVIRQPRLQAVFVSGWVLVAIGVVMFLRGFRQFLRS